MDDIIHFILYGIFCKIVDDFYDEEIYKECFPNANTFFKCIIVIYTIYLFYFNTTDSTIFLSLFLLELGFITFLFFNYIGWNDLSKIAEINPTLDDPFTLLSIVLLPNFILHFYKIIKKNYILLLVLCFGFILSGIIGDVDNSLLGKYVFKNKYNHTPNKKKYKFIYRIGLTILYCLIYKLNINNITNKCCISNIFYLLTSVCSLLLQIILEEYKEHQNFIEKINNIKNKLFENNILNE